MKQKVLVYGYNSYARPFINENNEVHYVSFEDEIPDLSDFSYVVFTGGEDIDPFYYKEDAHPYTSFNIYRDKLEVALMSTCLKLKVPTVGICRGMQLQTIMNGGKLIQHISHHSRFHGVRTYKDEVIQVNSLHHQLCFPVGDYKVLAWTEFNPVRRVYPKFGTRDIPVDYQEPEAIWFPRTKCLGVQYHPEMMHEDTEGYKFFQQILKEYLA